MQSPKIHRVLEYTDKVLQGSGAAIGLRRASKNKEMWTKKKRYQVKNK